MAYVKKSYMDLPNDKYPVSKEELKAQYNKDKNMYKVDDEIRKVNYIAVNIEPSQADIAEGRRPCRTATVRSGWRPLRRDAGR